MSRSGSEELAFRAAELDLAMQEAGFSLAYADPEAAKDFGYRARYIRPKSTMFPLLNANLEFYLAAKAFSLKISTADEWEKRIYDCLVKNHQGSLKELMDQYFASVRRGEAYVPGPLKS